MKRGQTEKKSRAGDAKAGFWSAVSAEKAAFRQKVAGAVTTEESQAVLRENLALLGIDTARSERPRLVAINRVRLGRR